MDFTKKRWIVQVTYATRLGPCLVTHEIEELDDVASIIEKGPNWNSLVDVKIILNPARRSSFMTVEESYEQ